MTAPLLEFDDFRLHFDTFDGCYQALDGVTLSIAPGESLGIVGETGCGKSVTAKSVLGLVPSPPARVAGGDYADVQGRYITTPTNVATIGAHPGINDHTPADTMEPVLTLTTCHPQFSNAERMIIHAVQTEATDKAAGIPAAMTEVS